MALRLVVVDDHPALREGLELLLEREGCEVVGTAGSAAEGERLVRRLDPDIALVDIRLGEADGIQLTRDLIAADPQRRVVLYTGSSDTDLLLDGLDSGARGYALKDGSPKELAGALALVRDGASYVDPRLKKVLSADRVVTRRSPLSAREREVLDLLAGGLTGEQVAVRLFLSTETIKTHVRNAMGKLGATTRVHAIAIALREGYIGREEGSGRDG